LLVVEDYIGGSKVGEVVKLEFDGNDLFTSWILRAFYSMFVSVGTGGTVSFSVLDDGGVSRTLNLKRNMGATDHIFNTNSCSHGVRVRFGANSTPPSRTDNRLLQELYVDGAPRITLNEIGGFVLIEGIAIFSSGVNVCEVGLSLYGTVAGVTICGDILIDRTVFSPCRSIPANTPYTVRYRLQL
jgi:hypothetical protein